MSQKRKLAAILAADVAGYSRLMADDEPETLRALNNARDLFRAQIDARSGRLIDTAGDSVLAEFASAVEAVSCAESVQEALAQFNADLPEHRRMRFRIGVNLGDVIEEAGGLYGDGVNVAARLQALAEPGSLCISGTVFDQVEGKLPRRFRSIGEQTVKNIPKPIRAYLLLHQDTLRTQSRRARTIALAAAAASIAALFAIGWWYSARDGASRPSDQRPLQSVAVPRVAVLPLANFSGDQKDEYFSDGMTEELISKLSRVGGLDVIARTSVMQYKTTHKSIADVGRDLNVSAVLEGSVRKAGDKIRITVQLIDVATQGHLWSEDFDRDLKDIFATQSEIAERVASAMHVKLVETGQRGSSGRASGDPEAYLLYLKGLSQAGKLTPDGLKESIGYFDQALRKSPNDARSWAGLAKAYAMLGWWAYAPPAESFQKAKVAAERALVIDETLPEAHISLGMVRFLFDWDWPGAEQAYLRAIELSPGSADAHLFHGIWLKAMARNEQAAAEIRRANDLDPLYLMANAEIGWVAYFGGRLDEAARACRRTLEMDPNYLFAMTCLQNALALKKDPESITLAKRLIELTSGDAYFLGQLAWAYGLSGNAAEARRILEQLHNMPATQPAPPGAILYIYMGLGDRDGTMEWLEKAYAGRWSDVVWIKSAPEFDWLRADPRFQSLLKKLKLDS